MTAVSCIAEESSAYESISTEHFTVSTDKQFYTEGDTLKLSITPKSGVNPGSFLIRVSYDPLVLSFKRVDASSDCYSMSSEDSSSVTTVYTAKQDNLESTVGVYVFSVLSKSADTSIKLSITDIYGNSAELISAGESCDVTINFEEEKIRRSAAFCP